jgi:hypothetical protein
MTPGDSPGMTTADTARRQHIRPGLGGAHNVATAVGLQRVRQRARRLVSHFAGQFTGAWRSDAGSPTSRGNAMVAQHGHPLATAQLSAAMVPQHRCMQEGLMGAHQWRPSCRALAQRSTGSRVASLAHLPAPSWRGTAPAQQHKPEVIQQSLLRHSVGRRDDCSGAALLTGLMSMSCPISRRS